MEDLTLTSFKEWMCCKPILPKALAHSLNFPKKLKIKKIKKKTKQYVQGQVSTCGRRATASHPPPAAGCPNISLYKFFIYFSCPPFFLHEVNSSPAHAHLAQSLPKNFKQP
jgi:hypothetical protein